MSSSPALEFTERRGFTLIGGHPANVGPVAVLADGSRESFEAVLAAAGQAMNRNCGMVVLSVFPDCPPTFDEVDEETQNYVRRVLDEHHVAVMPNCSADLTDLIELAEEIEASLLVLNPAESAEIAGEPDLMAAMIRAPFDLFMMAGEDRWEDLDGLDYSRASSATSIEGSSVRSQA